MSMLTCLKANISMLALLMSIIQKHSAMEKYKTKLLGKFREFKDSMIWWRGKKEIKELLKS
jgi:hypothetical protein